MEEEEEEQKETEEEGTEYYEPDDEDPEETKVTKPKGPKKARANQKAERLLPGKTKEEKEKRVKTNDANKKITKQKRRRMTGHQSPKRARPNL